MNTTLDIYGLIFVAVQADPGRFIFSVKTQWKNKLVGQELAVIKYISENTYCGPYTYKTHIVVLLSDHSIEGPTVLVHWKHTQ